MGNCSSCPSNKSCSKKETGCEIKINPRNKIKNVIGVMSGKGGVGKSTVSVLLAKTLKDQGYKVGILDADITGPSIINLLGIEKDKKAMGNSQGEILPVTSKDGIKAISLNLLMEDEDQPVIWRGSLLSNCVLQFWKDVIWGDLDYLVIDMPPGTGDITLTIMQSIPLSGLVFISVPQSMISMIVTKSINMAKKMGIKIYGIVENMSYILCPGCSEKIYLHEENEIENLLNKNNLNLLAKLPTTKGIINICNTGFENLEEPIKKELKSLVEQLQK